MPTVSDCRRQGRGREKGALNVVRRHKLRLHGMSALLATEMTPLAAFHGDGSTPSWREGQALLHGSRRRGSLRRVKPLEHPDSLHLQAAEGWLELGNHIEANEELENITHRLRVHPDVLELRWQIFARARQWDACLRVAGAILQLAPERASGWIMQSIALQRLSRVEEAFDTLHPVAEKFSDEPAVAYDLACYACRLGRTADAEKWLARVFESGDANRWRQLALDDANLEPLWDNIGECKWETRPLSAPPPLPGVPMDSVPISPLAIRLQPPPTAGTFA